MIISGLPFLSINRRLGLKILKRVHSELLKPKVVLCCFNIPLDMKTLYRYFHFREKTV